MRYLVHVTGPADVYGQWIMARLAPHLQCDAGTSQRWTFGPVELPEHVVTGLRNPERVQELRRHLRMEHGHTIHGVELEAVP